MNSHSMSKTPPHKNQIVIAAAGGRKTTFLVEEALRQKDKKILITTYTTENLDQITAYFIERAGCVPSNITILSWFTFLLRDGVWPYQNYILQDRRVESLDFKTVRVPIVKGGRKNPAWYLNRGNFLYKDRASEFVCQCSSVCDNLIVKRLEKIYDVVFVDEMQDLVGWDQELIESLMKSSINITLVGDPRQATYGTNHSSKNKAQKGRNMTKWIEDMVKGDLCVVEERTECFRCNQNICSFADDLYPELPKTESKNGEITGHDGIFTITPNRVNEYFVQHNPKVLRWNIRADTMGLPAMNIGTSKGRTFDRVLIFPTKPMKEYLRTKDISRAGDLSKLYVAITRARYSVTFVVEEELVTQSSRSTKSVL